MFNMVLESKVDRLRTEFEQHRQRTITRLDTLDALMYDVKNWMRRVEAQLGVTEVMNNRQEYVFLGTKQTPLKGYYNEDGANGESTPDE